MLAISGLQTFSHSKNVVKEINTFTNDNPVRDKSSIEDFLIENSAQLSVAEYIQKLSVTQLLSNPVTASDPDVLMEVQRSILDYGLKTSLASALVRKAVGAVEGVLRG